MKKKLFADGVFIELRGNYRLIAEGIDALLVYEHTKITVGAGTQRITFVGDGLELCFLSEYKIVVEGHIREVRYEE